LAVTSAVEKVRIVYHEAWPYVGVSLEGKC
jgi:hypothetical protein